MTNHREILRLFHQGISQRSIASSCACSRNTVSNVLNRAQDLGLNWPLPNGMSDAELKKLFTSDATRMAIPEKAARLRVHSQGDGQKWSHAEPVME